MAASSHQQQNGQIIGLGGIGALDNDADTKLFVVKKTGDSQGITALISRQLQGMYHQFSFLPILKNSTENVYDCISFFVFEFLLSLICFKYIGHYFFIKQKRLSVFCIFFLFINNLFL